MASFSRIFRQATNSMLSRDSVFSFLLQADEGKFLIGNFFVNRGCIEIQSFPWIKIGKR
jgi:hypothetical protein